MPCGNNRNDSTDVKVDHNEIMATLRLRHFHFYPIDELSWTVSYGFSEKEFLYHRQEPITTFHDKN